jgi:hypothetical protein
MLKLDLSWKAVKQEFKLTKIIGSGIGGQVVKAIHRESGKAVAIKKIDCNFE